MIICRQCCWYDLSKFTWCLYKHLHFFSIAYFPNGTNGTNDIQWKLFTLSKVAILFIVETTKLDFFKVPFTLSEILLNRQFHLRRPMESHDNWQHFKGWHRCDWLTFSWWLLIPWLLMSPGHQHPWYWLSRLCRSWSYLRKDFKCLCHINVEEWHKI